MRRPCAFIVTGAAVAVEALIAEPKSDVIDLNVGAAAAGQTSKRSREDAGTSPLSPPLPLPLWLKCAVSFVADLDIDAVTASAA